MQIATLSVNHKIAPIEIREKVAFPKEEIAPALAQLYSQNNVEACIILSTCNRSEISIFSKNDDAKKTLINWFSNMHHIEENAILPYLNFFFDTDAVLHMARVASGIDSLALGEPQILGQLKSAYHLARQSKTLNKVLEKLLQHTFSVAKNVRSNTKIGHSAISIAYCGVKLAQQIFSDLSEKCVLLIGAGDMTTIAAQYFKNKNVKRMIIANRTIKHAQKIANIHNAEVITLTQFPKYLAQADIIFTATANPVPILGKGLIETALKQRKHKPIFILDVAVPRDVEPEISQLEDVYLYNIDDLKQVVKENFKTRDKEKQIVEKIITEKTQIFMNWLEAMPNENIIEHYLQGAQKIKQESLNYAFKKLAKGEDHKIVMQMLADQLTNKLVHNPFKNIKNVPKEMLTKCVHCVPSQFSKNDIELKMSKQLKNFNTLNNLKK